jgi:hypothetical protein
VSWYAKTRHGLIIKARLKSNQEKGWRRRLSSYGLDESIYEPIEELRRSIRKDHPSLSDEEVTRRVLKMYNDFISAVNQNSIVFGYGEVVEFKAYDLLMSGDIKASDLDEHSITNPFAMACDILKNRASKNLYTGLRGECRHHVSSLLEDNNGGPIYVTYMGDIGVNCKNLPEGFPPVEEWLFLRSDIPELNAKGTSNPAAEAVTDGGQAEGSARAPIRSTDGVAEGGAQVAADICRKALEQHQLTNGQRRGLEALALSLEKPGLTRVQIYETLRPGEQIKDPASEARRWLRNGRQAAADLGLLPKDD